MSEDMERWRHAMADAEEESLLTASTRAVVAAALAEPIAVEPRCNYDHSRFWCLTHDRPEIKCRAEGR